MNYRPTVHLYCLALVSVLLYLLPPSSAYYLDPLNPPTAQNPENVPGLYTVPLYSGAINIDTSRQDNGNWEAVSYTVSTDSVAIIRFYRDRLPEKGWVIDSQSDIPLPKLTLTWANEPETLPFHLELKVQVKQYLEDTQSVRSYVDLRLARIPRDRLIPTYPGARNIDVKTALYENGQEIGRLTTFVTTASILEVQNYYKNLLVQYGYHLNQSNLQSKSQDLVFKFFTTEFFAKNPYNNGIEPIMTYFYSAVTITAKVTKGGLTQVEISTN